MADRGNGAEVVTDSDDEALLAKQKAAEDTVLATQAGIVQEHGDVGQAGSYKIDSPGTTER